MAKIIKPSQKVREELQQTFVDEDDLIRCFNALREFVLDDDNTYRRALRWGNTEGPHRDQIRKEFLVFFRDIFVPNFFTYGIHERNPNLSKWQSPKDPQRVLAEFFYIRSAMTKIMVDQKKNAHSQPKIPQNLIDLKADGTSNVSDEPESFTSSNKPELEPTLSGKKRVRLSNEVEFAEVGPAGAPISKTKQPMPIRTSKSPERAAPPRMQRAKLPRATDPGRSLSPLRALSRAANRRSTSSVSNGEGFENGSNAETGNDGYHQFHLGGPNGSTYNGSFDAGLFEALARATGREPRLLLKLKIAPRDIPCKNPVSCRKDEVENLHSRLFDEGHFVDHMCTEMFAQKLESNESDEPIPGLTVHFVITEVPLRFAPAAS